jgi:hypothetical protein
VLATTRPPTIEAKMSIGPLMICGMAKQVISRLDLLETRTEAGTNQFNTC